MNENLAQPCRTLQTLNEHLAEAIALPCNELIYALPMALPGFSACLRWIANGDCMSQPNIRNAHDLAQPCRNQYACQHKECEVRCMGGC